MQRASAAFLLARTALALVSGSAGNASCKEADAMKQNLQTLPNLGPFGSFEAPGLGDLGNAGNSGNCSPNMLAGHVRLEKKTLIALVARVLRCLLSINAIFAP